MFYQVDPVAQADRYFSKNVRYSEIDWSNLDRIVDAFGLRIREWYVEPARELATNIHFAFAVMAINCLLIDALSQFVAGKDSSEAGVFKQFIRTRLPPTYSRPLPRAIQHAAGTRKRNLVDVADVLYYGFRCGTLHKGHMLPYCGVVPNAFAAVQIVPTGMVKYSSGADCPAVVIDPLALLGALLKTFESYLDELKDRNHKNDRIRTHFKSALSNGFGVDITAAV